MVHTKIPTLKAITVSVCVSILLSMSALAEAAGAHKEHEHSGIQKKTETVECTESNSTLTLSDGDTILGGTYSAEGENESVLEASSSVEASVTGAVLQKLSGSASSADASSFRGVNAAVRAYGNAVIRLSQCEIQACDLYAKDQALKGNISVDSMSSLLMDLRSSTFSGAIQGEGNVNVSMDSDSRWVLSGDSSVTSLDGDLSGLDLNGHQLYINGVLYGE